MKQFINLSIVLAFLAISFSSCSSDDDKGFDYDIEILIGTWKMTHYEIEGELVDITKYPWTTIMKATYATFKADGAYTGKGEFGNGSGTYVASGNTITCFVDGEEYIKYTVITLTSTECELKMTMDNESVRIRCKKQ